MKKLERIKLQKFSDCEINNRSMTKITGGTTYSVCTYATCDGPYQDVEAYTYDDNDRMIKYDIGYIEAPCN